MTAPTTRRAPDEVPEPVCLETEGKLLPGAGSPTLPVLTEFRYDPAAPFAVTIAFVQPSEVVEWSFGRDLLDAGVKDWAGQGDVRIWPTDAGNVHIRLSSPDGEALFEYDKKFVKEFLKATYAQVPRHKELRHIDVDSAIQKMIGRAAA